MPKYDANLTFLFTSRPFPNCSAAAAGFRAVEYMSLYEHPPEDISRKLEDTRPEALFNLPADDWAAASDRQRRNRGKAGPSISVGSRSSSEPLPHPYPEFVTADFRLLRASKPLRLAARPPKLHCCLTPPLRKYRPSSARRSLKLTTPLAALATEALSSARLRDSLLSRRSTWPASTSPRDGASSAGTSVRSSRATRQLPVIELRRFPTMRKRQTTSPCGQPLRPPSDASKPF